MGQRRRSTITRQLRSSPRSTVRVTSLVIPTALHKRATQAAQQQGWSLAEVFRTALTEWLERHEAARKGAGS